MNSNVLRRAWCLFLLSCGVSYKRNIWCRLETSAGFSSLRRGFGLRPARMRLWCTKWLGQVFLRVHPFPPSVTFHQFSMLNSFTDASIILAVDSVFVHGGQLKSERSHTGSLSPTYPHKIYVKCNLPHATVGVGNNLPQFSGVFDIGEHIIKYTLFDPTNCTVSYIWTYVRCVPPTCFDLHKGTVRHTGISVKEVHV